MDSTGSILAVPSIISNCDLKQFGFPGGSRSRLVYRNPPGGVILTWLPHGAR
jgi:hypothetical protein